MHVGASVHHQPVGSYHSGPLDASDCYSDIHQMEVSQVTCSSPPGKILASTSRGMQSQESAEPVTKFTTDINEAINAKQACLHHAEAEMLSLKESLKDEQTLIENFASGDAKDIISLNVSGTMMVTTRSTLCTIKDSVLAQQFDDSKWTEQGCNGPPVNEWTTDEVSTWAKSVEGRLPEEVSIML